MRSNSEPTREAAPSPLNEQADRDVKELGQFAGVILTNGALAVQYV